MGRVCDGTGACGMCVLVFGFVLCACGVRVEWLLVLWACVVCVLRVAGLRTVSDWNTTPSELQAAKRWRALLVVYRH
jgi:hypothetical protein